LTGTVFVENLIGGTILLLENSFNRRSFVRRRIWGQVHSILVEILLIFVEVSIWCLLGGLFD